MEEDCTEGTFLKWRDEFVCASQDNHAVLEKPQDLSIGYYLTFLYRLATLLAGGGKFESQRICVGTYPSNHDDGR